MLKEKEKVPIEDDPQFVLLRVAREMSNWFAENNTNLDRDKKYEDLTEYFRNIIEISESVDVASLDDKNRQAVEYGLAWLKYSGSGADGVAAFIWMEVRRALAQRVDSETQGLIDLISPMMMSMTRREYILSVDTAEDAQEIWSRCGAQLRDAVYEVVGEKLRVMLFDNDFGVWGDEAA